MKVLLSAHFIITERIGKADGVTIEDVPLYRFLLEMKQGKYGAAYWIKKTRGDIMTRCHNISPVP